MSSQRTYWHLEGLRRVPSEYDIATSRLLYYPGREFAIESPVSEWYERYQRGSALVLTTGEHFEDPRQTTYTLYTKLAKERETFVDGLFRSSEESGYDKKLSQGWVATLDAWLPVLLYPCHGLQMVAAYVAQMAPAGRLVMVGLFQAGDELRRVQRLAYRIEQLKKTFPDFGAAGKRAWQERAEWQPLRKLMEELLVTYDFGEAFVTFELVVKPLFDRLILTEFARLAESYGDPLLAKLFFSLDEDARWQREACHAIARHALAEAPSNRAVMTRFVQAHRPQARAALDALAPLWPSNGDSWARVLASLDDERDRELEALGLYTPGAP
jgi:toluene monooxygenase system protein E